ncbi:MAG: alpha/beta fold hydrolase [Bacteroidota bacterium]
MKEPIIIRGETKNIGRPASHPRRSHWKLIFFKKSLPILQHVAPTQVAKIIWKYFVRPGKARFSKAQLALVEKATVNTTTYRGCKIVTYRWGTVGPKALLCHGWRSKSADFRRMIEALVEQGFVVESIDMKAHGNSAGETSALPEFIEIFKDHYIKNAPYHTVVGYSLGGLTAGMVMTEIAPEFHPPHLILMAFPPYIRYFFRDIVEQAGCNERVYHRFCDFVEKYYNQTVDYYDLRQKLNRISSDQVQLIYDEDDRTVPIAKGEELWSTTPNAMFVRTQRMGHYQIIANNKVIDYITQTINRPEKVADT